MDNPYEFIEHIKNVNSREEKYYIIMKHVINIDYELQFKRFTIFNKNNNCHIIRETKFIE